jgi:hypothetical protein
MEKSRDFSVAAHRLLSADTLFALIRANFGQVPDGRAENAKISLPDALMSGFAMFSLKDPSLLAFVERRATGGNLQSIYGIEHVPGDTQMRTILDDVEPVGLRPVFEDVIRQLQRSKELDKFIFLGGSYLVSLDGTGYFSSKKIHCSSCLQKVNKRTGEMTYYHQLRSGMPIWGICSVMRMTFIVCRTKRDAEKALQVIKQIMTRFEAHTSSHQDPHCGYGTRRLRLSWFPFPQAEVQEGRQTLTLHMAESKGYEVSAEQNPSNHDPKKVE